MLLAIGPIQKLGNLLVTLIELILAFLDVALQSSELIRMFLSCGMPMVTVLPVSVQLGLLQICDAFEFVKPGIELVKFRLKIGLQLRELTFAAIEILAQLGQGHLNSLVIVNDHFLDICDHMMFLGNIFDQI